MASKSHDSVSYSLLALGEHDGDGGEDSGELDLNAVRISSSAVTRTSSSGAGGGLKANMFAGRLRGSQRITFLAVLLIAFLIIIWLLSHMETLESQNDEIFTQVPFTVGNGKFQLKPDGTVKASEINVENLENEYVWHQKNCYAGEPSELSRSISDIYKKLQLLKTSTSPGCRSTWEIFNSMLRMEEINAPIVLPEPFKIEVKGWLNNNQKLFEQVNHQVLYKVVNKGTFEESVFNPIRSKRPSSKPSVDPLAYIRNLTESTRGSCDFCNYEDHTAEDIFGRIDNEHSASCSNTFKLAKFHGLFFPKEHSPLNLSLIMLQDLFLRTSKEWFEKAHNTDKRQRFPSLMWDCLPHGGASQVHPHIHGILDPNQYAGAFEVWHQVSLQYFQKLRRSYWSDFVKLHFALGLGMVKGQAAVITPLTARKDNEYMILAPQLNEDFVSLIYGVLQTYLNRLQVYCFSGGGVYPIIGEESTNFSGMPVILRIGSRGTCSAIASDVSSLELYTVNNINSDLDKTFTELTKQNSVYGIIQ